MQWGVRLLGPIALSQDGQDLPLAGEKQRLVVAAVALSPGVVVPTQRIVDLLWGDAAPRTARRTVQSHIAAIRSVMGPEGPLAARGSGYVLAVDRAAVDLLAFEDAVSALLRRADADPASTARRLTELLAGWDEPLAGFRNIDCSTGARYLTAPRQQRARRARAVPICVGIRHSRAAAWSQAGAAMTLDEAVGCALTALADLTPPADRSHADTTG